MCPDGQEYQVADNNDACKSLACYGGTMKSCNRKTGAWSQKKVICAPSPPLTKKNPDYYGNGGHGTVENLCWEPL